MVVGLERLFTNGLICPIQNLVNFQEIKLRISYFRGMEYLRGENVKVIFCQKELGKPVLFTFEPEVRPKDQ